MARVLISVRNAAETECAIAGGAAIIDIKEPLAGALGPAHTRVWCAIAPIVRPQRPLSIALGELLDAGLPARIDKLPVADYAKIGLAGCAAITDWPSRWQHAIGRLPDATKAVAVVYADWQTAAAPAPSEIIECAANAGCHTLLIDTYDKNHGWLLDHLAPAALAQHVRAARQASMRVAIAGSVSISKLPHILPMQPDWVAVRGAVCRGARTNAVSQRLVRCFVRACEQGLTRECRTTSDPRTGYHRTT